MDSKGDMGQLIAGLPDTEPRVLARARESMINGRNDLALQLLQAAVQKVPSSNLRIALGHVLARDQRYKDAMGHMVAILREEPRNAEALLLLTDALLECGEYDRAAKMLDRARACSADSTECARLTDKLANLTGETASNVLSPDVSPHETTTRPNQHSLGAQIEQNRDIRVSQTPGRERSSTVPGGRPSPQWDVGDPRGNAPSEAPGVPSPPLTPETLQSGTFSTLSGWSDDATIESGLYPGPDMGTPADEPPGSDELGAAISEAFDDFDIQDTMAFVPDDSPADQAHEYANPNDQTAAIVFDDALEREQPSEAVEREIGDMPSVEYHEESFQTEVRERPEASAPIHVEEEPTREREAWRQPEGDRTRDDVPSSRGMTPVPQRAEPAAEAPARVSAPESSPGQMAGGFQAPEPNFGDQAADLPRNPFGAPTFADPAAPAPRRPEPTGLTPAGAVSQETRAAEPKEDSSPKDLSKPKTKKRKALTFITLFVVLVALCLGGVGTVLYASNRQAAEISQMVAEAEAASSADTFAGYTAAFETLRTAGEHPSFLGRSVDDVLVGIVPPMGDVTATDLKRDAATKRAYIAAFVEYRFEQAGAREAASLIELAAGVAPDSSRLDAARAYVALADGRPHAALEILDKSAEANVGDLLLDQARVDAHLNLQQPAAAALALENFRTLEQPTVYQKLLLAHVDLALDDPAAATTLAGLRKNHPDHIDARIAQVYAQLEGDELREKAERSLKAIEGRLAERASAFQLARASQARGALQAAGGKKTEAEKSYRNAIRQYPARTELYLPLVAAKMAESDYDAVRKLLEKAEEEGATHPLLTLTRAQLLVLRSEPTQVISLLDAAPFEDGRKDLLIGLAHLELDQVDDAKTAFEAAAKRPGETPGADAFVHVAAARQAPEKAEDATYQVDRLASKHPRDAFVHWASALVRLNMADQMKDREAFEKTLDEAEKQLEEAIQLDPGWPLFHYSLCDVNLRGLEGKDAERACEAGKKLAPDYIPGLVNLAEVYLQKGAFEEASKLLDELAKKRPNSDRIALLAARTAIELGQHEQAEKTINKMLGKPISNGFEMKLLEGKLAFAQRNYAKASGYLASAHELRPQDGEAGIFYARTLTRLGKHDDAEEILQGHLRDRVWSAAAWTTFGEIRRRQGRYNDAFENLGIALRKLDDAPMPRARASELYLQSALTYRDRHNWNHRAVLSRLERALDKGDPDDAEVHYTLGLYHLKKRRSDESAAARAMQKVVDVAPWRCDAYKTLEALYGKLDADDQLDALRTSPAAETCKDDK